MNKPKLLRKLELIDRGDFSALSIQVVEDLINEYNDFQELYDYYPHEVENNLIYYYQAWNYLMDSNINDFTDAIDQWGAKTITEIAYYYLTEEVSEIINRLNEGE